MNIKPHKPAKIEEHKENKRLEALGYYETLENLLNDKNPIIQRHAKGILKEKQK